MTSRHLESHLPIHPGFLALIPVLWCFNLQAFRDHTNEISLFLGFGESGLDDWSFFRPAVSFLTILCLGLPSLCDSGTKAELRSSAFLPASADVTSSAPSTEPLCSSSDTKLFVSSLVLFAASTHSGLQLSPYTFFDRCQHLDFSLLRSHVIYHLCVSDLWREFPVGSQCLSLSFILDLCVLGGCVDF